MRLRTVRQQERRFRQINPVKVTTTYHTVRVPPPDHIAASQDRHGVFGAALLGALAGGAATMALGVATNSVEQDLAVTIGAAVWCFVWTFTVILVIRPLAGLFSDKTGVMRAALLGTFATIISTGALFVILAMLAQAYGFNEPLPENTPFGWLAEFVPFFMVTGVAAFVGGAAFAYTGHRSYWRK